MQERVIGTAMLTVLLLIVVCGISAPVCGQEASASSFYAKEATWQATVLGARAKYMAWRDAVKDQAKPQLGPWYCTGPLKANGFSDALFPEQGVSLDAKTPEGNAVWQKHEEWLDGAANNLAGGDSISTYLYRTITVPAAVTISCGLGSDDGVEVFLNGTKIFSNDAKRSVSVDQDRVELPLKAGENGLLLKVFNYGGGYGFSFTISDDPAFEIFEELKKDFPAETNWVVRDIAPDPGVRLINAPDGLGLVTRMIEKEIGASDWAGRFLQADLDALNAAKAPADDVRWLDLYVRACHVRDCVMAHASLNIEGLRRAIEDLAKSFPEKYAKGGDFTKRLDDFEKQMPELFAAMAKDPESVKKAVDDIAALRREALLANPLLDFDRLLFIKRKDDAIGLPQNWQGNCAISAKGYDNEISVLSPVAPDGKATTLYRPQGDAFVGDVDLNFDADKMLFSMPGRHDRWQIWEINADGSGLRQVTPGEEPDVDNYDPCYLPDGRIMFASTRCFQGIPCVGGSNTVANLCRMDADGQNARQLCFDQDHNWCPTVLNNGRVLYSRWEYSDTPHYFSRLLFSMNPDGTNQAEYYGSNSYWPNSTFYARPIPGSPAAVVAIVSGHHGVPRMGELIVFDPSKGRFEGDGVVQRIPGYGKKVEPVIMDTLVDEVWPRFLHPYPLSDKYFLVSCKPNPTALWGIYLVDVFDNMLLIQETPGYALLEPLPFRKTVRPPVVPDKVRLDRNDATVYLTDVYRGQGLAGVPRGTVKNLRIYEFHYTYPQAGGHINIGVEGPWDVHRILGTVPVYEDGSAYFRVPANIPIAVQPLDADGRAVQIMRSWFVGMPGESVSCVGCHERQNMTPPTAQTIAARSKPVDITPWKGPARGFSFKRDVQPALDKYCVNCHNGQPDRPNLARAEKNGWNNFTPSYLALHPYVRRPGPESDYHVQKPTEFHASTSELIQMIEKGHHGVKPDADAMDRIYTWIDLNVPDHGTWGEHQPIKSDFHQRRLDMRTKYANRPEDPEFIPDLKQEPVAFVAPESSPGPSRENVVCDGWPFDANKAAERQQSAGTESRRTIDLGNGVTMDLVLIPAGEFVMGSLEGSDDERPLSKVALDKPFWMGVVEVTNAQYQQFDPTHDSGFIDQQNKDHTTPGYSAQAPSNPVIRISWTEAVAFCQWLSAKAGATCQLPTEAQWEWACRAGTDTPFWYGGMDTDFSAFANLADKSIQLLAVAGINPQPIQNPSPYEDFLPKDARFSDGARIVTETGKYNPNPWGLRDMHGNVAEWTLSAYRPYPYVASDGRENADAAGKKVVRGGSWFDRPKRARSSFRLAYEPWQPVYNVGFRVVIPVEGSTKLAQKSSP